MWLKDSSVGRKVIMSVTGLFLILFVTFHVLMNAVAIFWPCAYNIVCEFLGANWYALIGTAVLAAGSSFTSSTLSGFRIRTRRPAVTMPTLSALVQNR